ncbi:MAG TPA: 6,7-dimethyl-8-ribityllumazine synthase [Myxococcales bacterium LLY-WYZ-16_1]|jgi:6,7-dimethyl-8-ribityllumazine synthase|nr:6,7-dimethyl-8-ribityllumazine synthase [Myxococcales bacterium LLY-WYZ-16_1]
MNARFGIAVARFNELITDRLLEGARGCLLRHGVDEGQVDVEPVPGAWELPLALRWMADSGRFDGLIAIGCVIRGSTPHFEYVAGEAAKGAAAVQMEARIPVGFGVLTTETIEQAIERAGTKLGNKGWDAAMAVIDMVELKRRLG